MRTKGDKGQNYKKKKKVTRRQKQRRLSKTGRLNPTIKIKDLSFSFNLKPLHRICVEKVTVFSGYRINNKVRIRQKFVAGTV